MEKKWKMQWKQGLGLIGFRLHTHTFVLRRQIGHRFRLEGPGQVWFLDLEPWTTVLTPWPLASGVWGSNIYSWLLLPPVITRVALVGLARQPGGRASSWLASLQG